MNVYEKEKLAKKIEQLFENETKEILQKEYDIKKRQLETKKSILSDLLDKIAQIHSDIDQSEMFIRFFESKT